MFSWARSGATSFTESTSPGNRCSHAALRSVSVLWGSSTSHAIEPVFTLSLARRQDSSCLMMAPLPSSLSTVALASSLLPITSSSLRAWYLLVKGVSGGSSFAMSSSAAASTVLYSSNRGAMFEWSTSTMPGFAAMSFTSWGRLSIMLVSILSCVRVEYVQVVFNSVNSGSRGPSDGFAKG